MSKMYTKILSLFISILIIFTSSIPSYAYTNDLDLVAEYAISMEANTGKVLYSKNADKKMYPASTTKVLTAHLVIKNIKNLDKTITVKKDLSWVEPSSMFLKVGESFTVRELLTVLMLKSANDVAVLLAEEVSGSIENFAKLMNDEAKSLGCTNTNFVNPNGLPDDNHYSTAYDMALIARACVRDEELMKIASTKSISLPANEIYPYERVYTNTNKFLTGKGQMSYDNKVVDYKYDIVDGLKTGYTSSAGRCLLATAKVGDTRIITGVFNSKQDNVYVDSRKLIDYSFNNFKTTTVVDRKDIESELEKKIFFSKEKKVKGYLKEGYTIVEEVNANSRTSSVDKSDYYYKVKMKRGLDSSVEKNEIVGSVDVYKDKKKIDSIDIYAKDSIHSILDMEQIVLLSLGVGILITILIFKARRRKIERKNTISRRSKNVYVKARERK